MSAVDPTAPEATAPVDGSDPATCRLLDELAANAAPAPVTRLVDGWLGRRAPGLPFRRANAVLPPPAGANDSRAATHALDVFDAWYRSFGQRMLVQVPSTDSALDEMLADRGLVVEAPVDILVAKAAVVAEAGSRSADRLAAACEERQVAIPSLLPVVGVDGAWAAGCADLHADDAVARARTEGYGRMLEVLVADGLAVRAVHAGSGASPSVDPRAIGVDRTETPVAVGFGVSERGWVGVFGMATAPSWRRRGVGGALLGVLATTAHKRGAHHLYLQVETENVAAQTLYRGLGFVRSHGYHYRVSEGRS